ncbi:MAG: YaiI/YqxD family protein [Acidobacteria bacterium]|nr:YaiI/YqxD family protein [Acidobacteriota bacterium]
MSEVETRFLIDADACPVKDEIYRVAVRYGIAVKVVTNTWMRTPDHPSIELILVEKSRVLDVADDWIADESRPGDVVITADIPLAARCVERGARVVSHRGKEFTPESIGDALATRDLMADLREAGEFTGGPPPFSKRDRSQFLQTLDAIVHKVRKSRD